MRTDLISLKGLAVENITVPPKSIEHTCLNQVGLKVLSGAAKQIDCFVVVSFVAQSDSEGTHKLNEVSIFSSDGLKGYDLSRFEVPAIRSNSVLSVVRKRLAYGELRAFISDVFDPYFFVPAQLVLALNPCPIYDVPSRNRTVERMKSRTLGSEWSLFRPSQLPYKLTDFPVQLPKHIRGRGYRDNAALVPWDRAPFCHLVRSLRLTCQQNLRITLPSGAAA